METQQLKEAAYAFDKGHAFTEARITRAIEIEKDILADPDNIAEHIDCITFTNDINEVRVQFGDDPVHFIKIYDRLLSLEVARVATNQSWNEFERGML